MSIENPKIEDFGKEEKTEAKLKARERIKKKTREMLAWGFITMSTLGIAKVLEPLLPDESLKKGKTMEQILKSDIRRDKELDTIGRKELWRKINDLKEQFGELILLRIKACADYDKETGSSIPKINGFEKLHPELGHNSLRYIWNEKYYPQGWINERIGEIKYVDKIDESEDIYWQDPEKWETTASYNSRIREGRAKVIFFKPSGSLSGDVSAENVANVLDHYFGHEIGHANDWEEEDLDFKNRVDFLYEVALYCFREGAFRDDGGYVESINNEDPKIERYCKVIEYWGELCEHYFSVPEDFQKAWPLEFNLVDRHIKEEDPDYNPIDAHEKRAFMRRQISNGFMAVPKDLKEFLK